MRFSPRGLLTLGALAGSLSVAGFFINTHLDGARLESQGAAPDVQHIAVTRQLPPSEATLQAFRSKIQHIVFIVKENRSFDTYFGTFPGADGVTAGIISTGERFPLRRGPDRMPHDIGHDWEDARRAMHDGRMDRFDLVRDGNQKN